MRKPNDFALVKPVTKKEWFGRREVMARLGSNNVMLIRLCRLAGVTPKNIRGRHMYTSGDVWKLMQEHAKITRKRP